MGKKRFAHRFCPECGSSVMIDFKNADSETLRPLLGMNVGARILHFCSSQAICSVQPLMLIGPPLQVRLFDDVDLENADYVFFDGRNRM